MVPILDAKIVQAIQIDLMHQIQQEVLVIAKMDFTNLAQCWSVKLAILHAILAQVLLI